MVKSIELNFGIDRILSPDFTPRKSSPRLSVKEITKSKSKNDKFYRSRVCYTYDQLQTLESAFMQNQYVIGGERILLAKRLNLEPKNVKIWFQNRRIRYRKQQSSSSDSDN